MRLAFLASLASSLVAVSLLCACAQDKSSPPAASTAGVPGAPSAQVEGGPGATGKGDRGSELAVTSVAEVKPLSQKTFGQPISETTNTSLASITEAPATFDGKTIRTEGRVTAVCQAMGCWMEIGDDKSQAHIKMAGHSFLVPKSASGHRAVVQGKVVASPQGDTCGAKDNCRGEAEKATGAVAKVEIEATGIEFVD